MLEEIQRLEEALRRAMLASEVGALDILVGDSLVFVTPDGSVTDKAADLAAHRSGAMRFEAMVPSEQQVMIFGDTAVVMVRMAIRGALSGRGFDSDFRYTRVWVRAGGRWRIVAGHASAIAPGPRISAG